MGAVIGLWAQREMARPWKALVGLGVLVPPELQRWLEEASPIDVAGRLLE